MILNLFVAIQACLDLAAHWLADEGWEVPQRYGDIFLALAEWKRIHEAASSTDLADLEAFCAALAARLR